MDVSYPSKADGKWIEPLRRVYLVHGEDAFRREEVVAEISRRCLDPAFADFDAEEFDGVTGSVTDVLASALRAPLSSPSRLVVVRSAEVYRRRERRADAERLAEGVRRMPSASCLVLVKGSETDARGRSNTILTVELDAAVRESGTVVRCVPLDESGLAEWLVSVAAEAGKKLPRTASVRLARVGGGERSALLNEINKVICLVGDRDEIVMADVEQVVADDPEDVVFRLVDAVSQRKAGDSLALLRRLAAFETRSHTLAGRLIALLVRQFRLLWQARTLLDRGLDPRSVKSFPKETLDALPSEGSLATMAWKAGAIGRDARLWTCVDLRQAFEQIMEQDAGNKGDEQGTSDVYMNLEMMIVRLCGTGP